MVTYDNEYETKTNAKWTKAKIELHHIYTLGENKTTESAV